MNKITAALALVFAATAFSHPESRGDDRGDDREAPRHEWRGSHEHERREWFERQRMEQERIRLEIERERQREAREYRHDHWLGRHEARREAPRCERTVEIVEVPSHPDPGPRARIEINWP